MAKKLKSAPERSVYRVTDIIGTSEKSWEDAAKNAVETAAHALHDLRVAEVNKLDMVIENGKVTAYRAKVSLSFKYAPYPGPAPATTGSHPERPTRTTGPDVPGVKD